MLADTIQLKKLNPTKNTMKQNKIFEGTSVDKVQKSAFDLTHMKALTGNIGKLIPTFVSEVLPSDEFNLRQEIMVRFQPQLAPWFGMMDVTTHFFFVPNRIIWSEWKDFITGGKDGTSSPTVPSLQINTIMASVNERKELGDYLGLPSVSSGSSQLKVSSLVAGAYQKIWNDYYRDQNLTDELDIFDIVQSVSTSNINELYKLRDSAYQKDYFTSALPFLQRGVQAEIPIDIEYKDVNFVTGSSIASGETFDLSINKVGTDVYLKDSEGENLKIENLVKTNFDISIHTLRTTSALQRFFEKQAVQGYRYTETLKSHFNVTAGDARLQRAEYIGGGKQPVVVSEVLSNTKTLDSNDNLNNPVGEMAGHSITTGQSMTANYKVQEHGFIIGITRVLPTPFYYQGVPKHFLYDDKFDYAWPELANLGEQPIKKCELFYNKDSETDNNSTFGYQSRYAQYKFIQSTVHGDFRSSMDFWTLGRSLSSTTAALNENFISVNEADYRKLFAVNDDSHKLMIQVLNHTKALRPLPYFANPQLS